MTSHYSLGHRPARFYRQQIPLVREDFVLTVVRHRFDVSEERVKKMNADNVEIMKFGFK